MSNNREISQLASVLKVKESSNFIGIATEGIQIIGIGTDSISLNGTNGTISATSFDGNVTGNITGTADNFTVTANNSTDETVFPVFVDGATGSQGAETDTDFNYNPNSGTLSATKFAGDGSLLTNVQGTGGSGVASTIAVSDESSDSTCFPIFATESVGNVNPKTGSNLTFNSSTGILAAESFTGTINTAEQTNITSVGTLSSLNLSGDINITSTNPKIIFTDSNGAPDYNINCEGGTLRFNDSSNNNRILINVDGHIDIPGRLDVASGIDVTGHTELDNVNVSGVSTFTGAIDANGGLDVSGGSGLVANSAKVSDLTSGRVVLAGASGELEDTSKLTFDGTTLAIVGDATFTGNVSIAGTLTKEDVTNIDSVGLITARTGVRVTSGGLVVSSGIATFTDNIIANGNIVGDNSTNITGINQVTATTFSGALSGNATSATTATNVTVADESSDTTCFPLFVTAATGDLAPKSGSNLTFNSSTGTLTATDFNSASDENLKQNIRTIENPLAKVAEIRGVNFDWKENQKPSVGVIAQEVEKVFPELVTSGEKKSVNYNGLIGLLIEVVKEQQTQIDSLNERLSRLE
jgi:hypothetical protein